MAANAQWAFKIPKFFYGSKFFNPFSFLHKSDPYKNIWACCCWLQSRPFIPWHVCCSWRNSEWPQCKSCCAAFGLGNNDNNGRRRKAKLATILTMSWHRQSRTRLGISECRTAILHWEEEEKEGEALEIGTNYRIFSISGLGAIIFQRVSKGLLLEMGY